MPQMNRVTALGVASSVCRTFAALALKLAKNHQVSDSAKCGLTTEHSVQMESLPLEYYPRKAAVSWEVWSLPRGPWQSLCCACFSSSRRDEPHLHTPDVSRTAETALSGVGYWVPTLPVLFSPGFSVFDLQCCVNFCCTPKWLSYTSTYSFPWWLITGYWVWSSLRYIAEPWCLSILYIIVCFG